MGPDYLYLGFVLLVQLGGIIYWASSIGARLKQVEKEQDKMSVEVDAINQLSARVAVLESLLNTQNEFLKEIRDEIRNRIYSVNTRD